PLMVTECMLPALWAHLAFSAQTPFADPASTHVHAPPRTHVREHGRPLEHTASRAAHGAQRAEPGQLSGQDAHESGHAPASDRKEKR
ncbi:MAG: hypothetical protein ACN6OQ_22930, partial [Paraburkholderia nemoris]